MLRGQRPSLGLGALTALLALSRLTSASPAVDVSLRTSWPAPPLLLEIIECISSTNPSAYYPLLSLLTDPTRLPSSGLATAESTYSFALQTAVDAGLLDAHARGLVEANMALHAAAPRIEAFYQLYGSLYGGGKGMAGKEGCESWVEWYGEVLCGYDEVVRAVGHETIEGGGVSAQHSRPKSVPFDHIHPLPSPSSSRPEHIAILYAQPSSDRTFHELHTYLLGLATSPNPRIQYIFRPVPPKERDTAKKSYLSGYGVGLDLKKMEYLAIDDRRGSGQGEGKEDANDADGTLDEASTDPLIALLQGHPLNTTIEVNSPLTTDELHHIGAQAVDLITSSPSPLTTLRLLAQNFPSYATSLARRISVRPAVQAERDENAMKVQGGMTLVWINGVVYEGEASPFAVLKAMRKEHAFIHALTSLGLKPGEAVSLVSHPTLAAAQAGGASNILDGIFDASDREEDGKVIAWWNDLEKDGRYSRWNPSVTGILRPMYPGQFHQIRLNLWNVVLVLDLGKTSSWQTLATVGNIISRNFPFRFGFVPIVEDEEGAKMAKLLHYSVERFGRAKTMGLIKEIAQPQTPPHLLSPGIELSIIRTAWEHLVADAAAPSADESEEEDAAPKPILSLDEALAEKSEELTGHVEAAKQYAQRLGVDAKSAPAGHAFVNGKHFDFDEDFWRSMQTEAQGQLQHLQETVYAGDLGDAQADTLPTYFYDLPSSSKRRNRYIFPAAGSGVGSLKVVSLPDVLERGGVEVGHTEFVYPEGDQAAPISMHIVADLDSEDGLNFIREALKSLTPDSLARLSFIHNPSAPSSTPSGKRASTLVSYLLSTFASTTTPSKLLSLLGLSSTTASTAQMVLDDLPLDSDAPSYARYVAAGAAVAKELGLKPGEQGVLVNGRVIGPIEVGGLLSADFGALVEYELRKRVVPVVEALRDVVPTTDSMDRVTFADLVAMSSSVLSAIQIPDPTETGLFNRPPRPRQRQYQMLSGEYTGFAVGDHETSAYHFGLVLDPLSETAQKWSSLLDWLSSIPGVYIEVRLNPAAYEEVPLKRFYRYNLLSKMAFDESGDEAPASVVFSDLPTQPIYTLAMDVPSSWLVRPREAQHDLDNLQLSHFHADERVSAVFELDHLVVEGHARESATNGPPRGLQLELVDGAGKALDDTQVVANLGYIQFKAAPGVFRLRIRAGRGREVFRMESVGNEGWNSPSVEAVGEDITVTDFEGLTIYPKVDRLEGMEGVDVLVEPLEDEEEEDKGVLGKLLHKVTDLFKKPKTDIVVANPGSEQAEINIFTVASGLLYERFLSIMVLSVLRNTKSTVKFWFIENFLSPAFLDFIPHFAAEYNFQYELVTYKWPSWLRAQKEKQRIIWAYKILFLDVLFPMDLRKVIFVDADQIVRADMKELVDLDLHGAPYGYTPMGDDNTDMEGFRFWKTGYWKDFLQGKPYHISALYVVDLVRFRQVAAGDMLRGQYQQLSADPNSLANLDQDLPNNLQREVPIFSLDEDWLWCETWCSKDRLHRAKTIDLCQNPLTKEPKLARARAIPEWSEYDGEIATFTRRLAREGKLRSELTTADVSALAGESAEPKSVDDGAEGEGVEERDQEVKHEEL